MDGSGLSEGFFFVPEAITLGCTPVAFSLMWIHSSKLRGIQTIGFFFRVVVVEENDGFSGTLCLKLPPGLIGFASLSNGPPARRWRSSGAVDLPCKSDYVNVYVYWFFFYQSSNAPVLLCRWWWWWQQQWRNSRKTRISSSPKSICPCSAPPPNVTHLHQAFPEPNLESLMELSHLKRHSIWFWLECLFFGFKFDW